MTLLPPVVPDFELLRRIGRGSYGDIWLGRSVTRQLRAVKVVYRDRFESERPFEREFVGVQKFEPVSRRHPSQLDVLHVGRNLAGGFFYYVMELADDASVPADEAGRPIDPEFYEPLTLKVLLERRGRLPVGEVLDLVEPLVEALQFLHAEGLVHRDIKPSNIVFIHGRAKLADLGLITAAEAAGSYVGTEGFVPREGPGSVSADLFALGKVIYEAATGRDRMEFPRLPAQLEALPDRPFLMELNEVWLKACDPEPGLRYATAADLRSDLALLKARKSVRRLRKLERQVRRGRRLILASLLAGLVIGYGWWQSHRFNRYAASQLAHVYVQHGQERLEQRDAIGALPWFAAAMELEQFDPARDVAHRLRLANTLAQSPELIGLHSYLAEPLPRYVFFDASGDRVLLCEPGDLAQVWDLKSESAVTPKLRHGGQVRQGWFNPGATRVATLSADGFVRLWDAVTGELKGAPFRHGERTGAACFAVDGSRLFTAGTDGKIAVWDLEGRPMTSASVGFPIGHLAISGDGLRLVATGDVGRELVTLDAGSLVAVTAVLELPEVPREVALGFRGQQVAMGFGNGLVQVRPLADPTGGRLEFQLSGPVFKLQFDREGNRLLVGAERTAGVIDLARGEPLFPLLNEISAIRVWAWSPDETRLLIAGESRTAQILDATTGEALTPPLRQAGEIAAGQFTDGGRAWLTASADRTTRRWGPPPAENASVRLAHDRELVAAALVADEPRVFTVDVEGVPRTWSWSSNQVTVAAGEPLGPAVGARLADGGGVAITATRNGELHATDIDTLACFASRAFTGLSSPVLVIHPNQPLVLASRGDRGAVVWNWKENSAIELAMDRGGELVRAEFSADGRWLAVGNSSGELLLWPTSVLARDPLRAKLSDRTSLLAFAATGDRLLVASEDRTFQWWDPRAGKPSSGRLRADAGVNFARVSPGATRVFTAGVNFEAMTWDTVGARPLTRPFRPHGQVVDAVFSPDSTQVVLLSRDGDVQLWHAEFGQPLGPILRGAGPVTRCAFAPDGRRWLTVEGGRDVVVRPLPADAPPAQELADQAALISSYRLDRDGLPQPLDVRALRELERRRRQ